MPYATNGKISQSFLPNSVKISEDQYAVALDAILAGKEVTIDGGFAVRLQQPSAHHVWQSGEWVDLTPEPDPVADPAPLALTARQLRLGLVTNGFALEQVEAAIAAIEDPQQRAVASIEWEYASQFERSHPLIEQVGSALGLTTDQIDTLWAEAALI